jgi:hypothetical protein
MIQFRIVFGGFRARLSSRLFHETVVILVKINSFPSKIWDFVNFWTVKTQRNYFKPMPESQLWAGWAFCPLYSHFFPHFDIFPVLARKAPVATSDKWNAKKVPVSLHSWSDMAAFWYSRYPGQYQPKFHADCFPLLIISVWIDQYPFATVVRLPSGPIRLHAGW